MATHLRKLPRVLPQVQVAIIDKRAVIAPNGTYVGIKGGPYNVSVILKVIHGLVLAGYHCAVLCCCQGVFLLLYA